MKTLTSITTMQELAQAAGVSIATVSRVFSGSTKVSEKTRTKVMELVHQSGFQPNETARTMAAGSSRLIAVILPDIENPYFSRLLSEVEQLCVKNGYTMIFFNSNGDSEKEKEIVTKMMARQADGMLICMTRIKSEMIPVIKTANFPVVVMTRNINGLDSVAINHLEGGRLAADYLIKNRCEQFFFFGLKDDEKFTGFYNELLKKKVPESKIKIFGDKNWYFNNYAQASELMDKFMQEQKTCTEKTGLFCINDLFAVQAINAANRNNIKIPEKLNIVGFDNTMLCDMTFPALTSINQPLDKIAAKSFEILCQKIKEKKEGKSSLKTIVLEPSIVKRES